MVIDRFAYDPHVASDGLMLFDYSVQGVQQLDRTCSHLRRESLVGTSSIAPALKEIPFFHGAATTVVTGSEIGLARRLDVELPSGRVMEVDGTPI